MPKETITVLKKLHTNVKYLPDHARVQVTDLFPPNDAATVAGRVRQLYDLLAPKAGA